MPTLCDAKLRLLSNKIKAYLIKTFIYMVVLTSVLPPYKLSTHFCVSVLNS